MSWWRVRDPGSFPPAFHSALRAGPGRHIIQTFYTKRAAEAVRRDWLVFTYSLRQHPNYPTARVAQGLTLRTSIRWDRDSEKWEFWLVARESVLQDLKNPLEVFGPEG